MKITENKERHILFLAPLFFGYYDRIRNELICNGCHVDYFSLESIKGECYVAEYWEHTLQAIIDINKKRSYDQVLIIGMGHLSLEVLRILRTYLTDAFFVHYNWDDVETAPQIKELYCLFDKCYSYSKVDTLFDDRLLFLPFFFSEKRINKKSIDISFIGSFHGDRLDIVKKIKRDNFDLNLYFHLYRPLSVYLVKPKYIEAFLLNILSVRKLNYMKVMDVFAQSKSLLEIQSAHQRTPTTRAIEAIGTQTKVITTCAEIRNYDYYNPQNVLIVDRKNTVVDRDWLKAPFKQMDSEIEYNYSLACWVKKILSVN